MIAPLRHVSDDGTGAHGAPPPAPQPADHVPVMLERCLDALAPQVGDWMVDATFGAGGHTRALLARGAHVLAIDRDPGAAPYVEALRDDLRTAGVTRPEERFRFAQGNFANLRRHLRDHGLERVQGVLLDLGVSSMQLDRSERGFAFRHEGPLDMRMAGCGESAADVVNTWTMEALAAALHRYGEERHSRRIARAIVAARDEAPITTTGRLVEVVTRAYPPGPRSDHPARRTFQALRIVVNDELMALERGLAAAADSLADGGRLVVLAYHSLEDRIVKRVLRDRPDLLPVTKRPVEASEAEVAANPRARSAKLRAAIKAGDGGTDHAGEDAGNHTGGGHDAGHRASNRFFHNFGSRFGHRAGWGRAP
jgi:16S rRNA (cytosine1402-N4)-methyltransferase